MTTHKRHINYIQPRLTNYPTFEKLLKAKSEYGEYDVLSDDKFIFKDLTAFKNAFVISEPGYGKTRLLKEIVLHTQEQEKQGIFLIFQINDKYSLRDYLPKMNEVYKDCHNVEIMGLNCIENRNILREAEIKLP